MAMNFERTLGKWRRWAGWKWLASLLPAGVVAVFAISHSLAIWVGMGGHAGLTNGWPLWRHDHPLYYHQRPGDPVIPA